MNVLLVVPWDQESGGVASVVGYLARHLESEGNRVLFLHPGRPETLRAKTTRWGFDGYEINLRTPFIAGRMWRSVIAFALTLPFVLFQLARLLRAERIRVVNIHYPGDAFVVFALLRRLLSFRLVISIHGMDMIRWNEPSTTLPLALRVLFRAADLVVGPSWRFIQRCDALFGSCPAKRIAIHNGVDFSELEGAAVTATTTDVPLILSVSSLDHWKGVDVLVRAIALVRDRGQAVRLVLAGEGPMRGELEHLIAELGLQNEIELAGQQSRDAVAQLLHECTIFVLASRFESFGIAAVEALACGKPVIATRVDGILEIIEHESNGLLTEPGDPVELGDAIARMLADESLRGRLGAAARASVTDRFRWQQMGQNYMQAYGEVLQRGA